MIREIPRLLCAQKQGTEHHCMFPTYCLASLGIHDHQSETLPAQGHIARLCPNIWVSPWGSRWEMGSKVGFCPPLPTPTPQPPLLGALQGDRGLRSREQYRYEGGGPPMAAGLSQARAVPMPAAGGPGRPSSPVGSQLSSQSPTLFAALTHLPATFWGLKKWFYFLKTKAFWF